MKKWVIVLMMGVVLVSSGCSAVNNNEAETTEPLPVNQVAATSAEGALSAPEAVEEPSTETNIEPTAPAPTPDEAISEIVHATRPDVPVYSQSLPGECNTGYAYTFPGFTVKPPCDNTNINLFERAVSVDLADFYHYVDILSAKAGKDNNWHYLSMELFGAGLPPEGVDLTYYFELDVDQDGRGDILLAVQNLDLYITDWTVSGVQVYGDGNKDNGGMTAIRPDKNSGDGYEMLLFDGGVGDDPDLVWVRHNPDRIQQVEFAFKPSLLNGRSSFMWWAGARLGEFDPAAFDFVDSQDLKAFYAVDTTCGMVQGQETAYNIRKCYIPPTPTQPRIQDVPPAFVCIKPPHPDPQSNCWIWFEDLCQWICFN